MCGKYINSVIHSIIQFVCKYFCSLDFWSKNNEFLQNFKVVLSYKLVNNIRYWTLNFSLNSSKMYYNIFTIYFIIITRFWFTLLLIVLKYKLKYLFVYFYSAINLILMSCTRAYKKCLSTKLNNTSFGLKLNQ